MSKKTTTRKRGFSFLSFFLGILIGIILIAGAVAGVTCYALYGDLDTFLGWFGVDNTDEDGNYVYINLDENNGGVKNAMQLMNRLIGMAGDYENLTIGEIEELLPFVSVIVDNTYDTLSVYVEIDADELRGVTFSEFPSYVKETVYDVSPAVLFEKFATNRETLDNILVQALLYGTEADCVTDPQTSALYPVYYDGSEESGYTYFFEYDNNYYVTERSDDGYVFSTDTVYSDYDAQTAKPTGNYYFDGDTRVILEAINVRTFMDGDPFASLNGLYVTDMFGEDDELIDEIFGGITIGDWMNGNVDTEEIVNNIEIAKLIAVKPDNDMMMYLGYGVTDVAAATGGNYSYTALRDGKTCYITLDGDGYVSGIYFDPACTEESKLAGTKVSEISEVIDGITVTLFIDVKPTDAIMAYLGYGIYDIVAADGGYTAKYDATEGTVTCNVETDANGVITSVWYTNGNGEKVNVQGTGINEINSRLENVTDYLALVDFIDVNAPAAEDRNAIMVYLGYGVYGIEIEGNEVTGKYSVDGVEKDCYFVIDGTSINDIYYLENGERVSVEKTKVGELPDRLGELTNVIKIKDLIEISPDDKLLSTLGEYTIATVGDAVNDLTVPDIMDVSADEAIMAYLGYGVYDIAPAEGADYNYTAKCDVTTENGTATVDCYILTDNERNITSVYYIDADGNRAYVSGTGVNDLDSRIEGLAEVLTLVGMMPANMPVEGNKNAIMVYMGYAVYDVQIAADGSVTGKYDVIGENGSIETVTCYFVADENVSPQTVSYIYYLDDGNNVIIPEVKLSEVNDRMGELKKVLTIGDVLDAEDYENSPILVKLSDTTIINLPDAIKTLTISDLLSYDEISGNTILEALKDSTLNSLADDIAALTVNRLYAEEIYGSAVLTEVDQSNFDAAYVYYVNDGDKYVLAGVDGKLTAFDAENTYYTYGEATALWKLMLYKDGSEQVYSINGFTSMIDNIASNIQSATIRELNDAGIITVEASKLDSPLILECSTDYNGVPITFKYKLSDKTFGEMTLEELIDVIVSHMAESE